MPGISFVVRVWAAVLARLGCVGCVTPRLVVVLLGLVTLGCGFAGGAEDGFHFCCRRTLIGLAVFLLRSLPFGIINENESRR